MSTFTLDGAVQIRGTDTGRVDIFAHGVNMYGCLNCPKCGSGYRWPRVCDRAYERRGEQYPEMRCSWQSLHALHKPDN